MSEVVRCLRTRSQSYLCEDSSLLKMVGRTLDSEAAVMAPRRELLANSQSFLL